MSAERDGRSADPGDRGGDASPRTLRSYAEEAGLGQFEVLDVNTDFWRFYPVTALEHLADLVRTVRSSLLTLRCDHLQGGGRMLLVPKQLQRAGMTGNVPYYGGRFTPAQAYAASHPVRAAAGLFPTS